MSDVCLGIEARASGNGRVKEHLLMDLIIRGNVLGHMVRDETEEAVKELIEMMEMQPIEDFIYYNTHMGPSFYQMLLESHVCGDYLHNELWMHISSCKDFDDEKVTEFVRSNFGMYEFIHGTPMVLFRGVGVVK